MTDNLLSQLDTSGMSQKAFWREHYAQEMSYNAFHGRVWRASQKNIIAQPELFRHDLGKPWVFDDHANAVIIGDIQLPTSSYDFMALPMAIGKAYLKRPRRLIIAGDLVNADAFSDYDADVPTPAMEQETTAGQAFFEEYLTVFDDIWWFLGNHDRRVGKRTQGALQPKHLLSMLTHDKRVKVSHWGHCVIKNPNGGYNWRVTHGSEYSVNQLVVSDMMALKYQQNIILHHEHHLGRGFDRYGRYQIVNNGGLFDTTSMGYVVLDDNKKPAMIPGFSLMRSGYVDLLGPEGFTNWDAWIVPRHNRALRTA